MASSADWSDAVLVAGIRAGDRTAFSEAFARHQSDVYRFARHMTAGDEALADDITQEVFLALMRRPDGYDAARGPLRGYLLGIARHAIASRLRERRWWGEGASLPDEPTTDDDPLAEVCRAQDVARVQAAVAGLPPAYRDALVSCDLLGLSYDEAAASLSCPVGTVRSRLHRARRLVGQALRDGAAAPAGRSELRCLA